MAEETDIVVVGAGILGTSVAYHLLQRQAGRVVVVDAEAPGAATSVAGAGFVGLWAAGYADFLTETGLELEQYGIDFYTRLAAEGAAFDHRSNGNLYLATTDEGWQRWVEPIANHPLAPAGTRQLSGDEVAGVTAGAIAGEVVTAGVLHPGGIQISAGRATRVLADRVVAAGGEIRTGTRVTDLLVSAGAVVGVRTGAGDITARQVVLACGAWTNELLERVDHRVPLLRMVATRAIAPPSGVSPAMPTVMVPDHFGLWLREHRGGLTYGNGDGYAPLVELGGSVGTGGQPRHTELVDRLQATLGPQLRKLVPSHDISVDWWLQGVPCMTPDRQFLAGAVPGASGLYVLAGDNEAGVTHGPGLGRLLAEIVVEGTSSVDASAYRLDRFDPAAFPTEQAVAAAMPVRR